MRVFRLDGLRAESDGDAEEADDIYDVLLNENPANQLVLKRRVAMQLEAGLIDEAIVSLNTYVHLSGFLVLFPRLIFPSLSSFLFFLAFQRRVSVWTTTTTNYSYLRTHSADSSGWTELCDLYCASGAYGAAAFCAEELLLIQPLLDVFHTRFVCLCIFYHAVPFIQLTPQRTLVLFLLVLGN